MSDSEKRLKSKVQVEVECERQKIDRNKQIKLDGMYTLYKIMSNGVVRWHGKTDYHIYNETYW